MLWRESKIYTLVISRLFQRETSQAHGTKATFLGKELSEPFSRTFTGVPLISKYAYTDS
jgi:hypothetical protein